ncbi:MAG TPA: hypothetical protein VMF29_01450, partial [Candidatus Edwardsbacteria bacterium]|nr:hypothetical protein [Candidatus Edwardsbacteria bacterium]
TRRCDKCGAAIPAGGLYYEARIVLDQGFDGVIVVGPDDDLQSLVRRVDEQTRGVPERLLEQDVHKEMAFLLCPRCRERFAANPLNLPLDTGGVPRSYKDIED